MIEAVKMLDLLETSCAVLRKERTNFI